jgi:AsmA protein
MNGSLRVDARSTPNIAFKQNMKGITIGPLLVDAINNDMLDGKGTLNVDVTTQGNTVGALKKSLSGIAALNLADGAVKGIDIAGKYRELKSKINVLKTQSNVGADQKQKTDFSEMKASFNIKNGVAHNDDLTMKAPLFRLAGTGDIDIESLNYTAKPTLVKTLKGQEGADLNALDGLTIPVKVTGTFSAPKYGIDYSAVGAALAKSSLLDKVGGSKGEAVKDLLGGNKEDALKSLLGGKKKADTPVTDGTGSAPPTTGAAPAAAEAKPESAEDKAKKKLNKLLGF